MSGSKKLITVPFSIRAQMCLLSASDRVRLLIKGQGNAFGEDPINTTESIYTYEVGGGLGA